MVSVPAYYEVVNMTIIPAAHLIEYWENGTYKYYHTYGKEYYNKAMMQICANNIYSSDQALKWAVYADDSRDDVNTTARKFFSEDNGNRMINCAYGSQGEGYIAKAYKIYMENWAGGLLPWIKLDNSTMYKPFEDGLNFLDYMCRRRPDRSELYACNHLSLPEELKFLVTENDDNNPNERTIADKMKVRPTLPEDGNHFDFDELKKKLDSEPVAENNNNKINNNDIPSFNVNEKFDYDKFWNSKDD